MKLATLCVFALSTSALAIQANDVAAQTVESPIQLAQRGEGKGGGGGPSSGFTGGPRGGGGGSVTAPRGGGGDRATSPRGGGRDRATSPRGARPGGGNINRTPRAARDFRAPRGDRIDRGSRWDRGNRINRGARWNRGNRHRGDWRRRGVRHFWGPGIAFYYYDGYYYGDCNWVRRRAIQTGSRYWWRRYQLCRWG